MEKELRAPYKLMQDFEQILREINEIRRADYISAHGIAGKWWGRPISSRDFDVLKAEAVEIHAHAYGCEYRFSDCTCMIQYREETPKGSCREIVNNLKDKTPVPYFENISSITSGEMLKLAFSGRFER